MYDFVSGKMTKKGQIPKDGAKEGSPPAQGQGAGSAPSGLSPPRASVRPRQPSQKAQELTERKTEQHERRSRKSTSVQPPSMQPPSLPPSSQPPPMLPPPSQVQQPSPVFSQPASGAKGKKGDTTKERVTTNEEKLLLLQCYRHHVLPVQQETDGLASGRADQHIKDGLKKEELAWMQCCVLFGQQPGGHIMSVDVAKRNIKKLKQDFCTPTPSGTRLIPEDSDLFKLMKLTWSTSPHRDDVLPKPSATFHPSAAAIRDVFKQNSKSSTAA